MVKHYIATLPEIDGIVEKTEVIIPIVSGKPAIDIEKFQKLNSGVLWLYASDLRTLADALDDMEN